MPSNSIVIHNNVHYWIKRTLDTGTGPNYFTYLVQQEMISVNLLNTASSHPQINVTFFQVNPGSCVWFNSI